MKLWLDLAEKSCKFTSEHCHKNWEFFKKKNYKNTKPLYALFWRVKSISPKKLEAVIPFLKTITANSNTYNKVSDDGQDYDKIQINQKFLTDNDQFNNTVKEFLTNGGIKTLCIKSRYGSGKTRFLEAPFDDKNKYSDVLK